MTDAAVIDAGATVRASHLDDPADPADRPLLALFVVFVATLLLVPERYTVPIGGQFGLRPHQLVLVVMAGILVVQFVRADRTLSVGRPAWIAGLLIVMIVLSIVVNQPRLTEGEFLGAVRVTVTTGFYVLLAMVVATIATSPQRRRFIVSALVTIIAVAAIFAVHESSTREPIRLDPTPPGLVEETQDGKIDDTPSTVIRNGVPRPAGLAANPLELSAVMALGTPFAAYLLMSARTWRARVWFLACTFLIALGVVLSISRTGMLAVAVMLLVAFVANLRRPRVILMGLLAVVVLGATVATLVPNSVDSLVKQFGKDGNEDPSLATRLQDYAELDNLLGPHAWFGRGPNTVSTYVSRDASALILDNQYLLTIADVGVIGLIALLALFVSTGLTAWRRARPPERGLFIAIVCAVVAFMVMCATFDVLRFSQATSIFMIAVGIASAVDRLDGNAEPSSAEALAPARVR